MDTQSRTSNGVVPAVVDATTDVETATPDSNQLVDQRPRPDHNNNISQFDTFKANLVHAGLYRPATDNEPPSHDDATLLRFLRARLYNPDKAQKHFCRAETWRKQHDVDVLFKSFDGDELESSRRFYPRWTGRRDKHGLPLYVYRLAALRDESLRRALEAVSPERRYQRIIALYEFMTRFVLPLCDHVAPRAEPPAQTPPPPPISSVTTIIDLGDMSLKEMWSLRNHLQQASVLATANYPETLNAIAVVNSPAFFPTVWNWVKGWFDERTRRKIHILGKDPGDTLRKLIDEENLPALYGGKLEWVFEDEPCLDSDIHKTIGEMPKGPAIFMDGKVAGP